MRKPSYGPGKPKVLKVDRMKAVMGGIRIRDMRREGAALSAVKPAHQRAVFVLIATEKFKRRESRRPTQAVIDAYLAAHPEARNA